MQKTRHDFGVNASLIEYIAWRILVFGMENPTVGVIKFNHSFSLMGHLFLGTTYVHSKMLPSPQMNY